ncbi:YceI family protein [Arenimonas alkanexedens]
MRLPVLLSLLLATATAGATDYRAEAGSTLGFRASYQGENFEGAFRDFSPAIRFDPADLAQSRFDVRIDLSSAGTQNADRDELLLGPDFFDSIARPEARYVATRFRALGGDRYVAKGELSLRGVSQPVALNFTWTAGAKPVLEGDAMLKRLAFEVGGGDWSDTGMIPDEVKVVTRLVLVPSN